MRKNCTVFISMYVILVMSACTAVGSYQSQRIYDKPLVGEIATKSFQYTGIDRNPVIVIPGILGSQLVDTRSGDIVWGKFTGKETITKFSDEKIRALSLPIQKGKALHELQDTVVATTPLDMVGIRLLGVHLHLNSYHTMLEALRFGGYYDESYSEDTERKYDACFPFGYDWRRDLAENAQRLHEFILEKKLYLQKKYEEIYGIKDYDVQFDIVAHSMGGLLSRYYLRYGPHDLPLNGGLPKITWQGSKHIDKVIIVGTPNAGYLDTVLELVNGLKISRAVPTYPPALVGTFPTLYEMLPVWNPGAVISRDKNGVGNTLDIFDPDVWIRMEWGLADPKQDKILQILLPDITDKAKRRAIVLDHLRKCLRRAKQFTDAMRVKAVPPDDVALHLFLGDAVETSEVAAVDMQTGDIEVIKYGPGDGKVLATSALMDERVGREWVPYVQSPIEWSSVTFLFAAHMGITRDQVFTTNMLYILLGSQTASQERINTRK